MGCRQGGIETLLVVPYYRNWDKLNRGCEGRRLKSENTARWWTGSMKLCSEESGRE